VPGYQRAKHRFTQPTRTTALLLADYRQASQHTSQQKLRNYQPVTLFTHVNWGWKVHILTLTYFAQELG
jgi:hypothetical protein